MFKKLPWLPVIAIIFCMISGCTTDTGSLPPVEGIEFEDGIYVQADLPEGFEVAANPYETTRIDLDHLSEQTFGIEKEGELVGSVTLVEWSAGQVAGRSEEEWLEACRQNPVLVYNGFFVGAQSGSWECEYESVCDSEDNMEGAAISYIVYVSSSLTHEDPNRNWAPDLSACKTEEIDDGQRCIYYNRAILGYNLSLKYWVGIELNYDCVTDDEHREIAESLRIVQG